MSIGAQAGKDVILDLRFIDDGETQKRVLQALVVKRRERINDGANGDVRTLAVWETVRLERYNAYDGQEVEFVGSYDPKGKSV